MSMSREELLFVAKLAEQAERYDKMAETMKKIAHMKVDLTAEERNLLSLSFKNVIGIQRHAWRVCSSVEEKEETKGRSKNVEHTRAFRADIEAELTKICQDVLNTIDEYLIDSVAGNPESQAFYHKMKGDYYRYLAEFQQGETRKASADNALASYQKASDISTGHLLPTNPILLGLALNFSVFNYEIIGDHKKACEIAKRAFDDAVTQLDQVPEDVYHDATAIMQLLRDNLNLWTAEEANEESDA